MSVNVLDALKAGRYTNEVPYDIEQTPVDDNMIVRQAREHKDSQQRLRQEHRAKYRAEEARLRALFQDDLEKEHGLSGHPKAPKVFEMAWDDRHSSGYQEVAYLYADLAELLK